MNKINEAINEIQVEIDSLNKRNDAFFREIELDEENAEYYENQIADNDAIILELEEQIHNLRLKLKEMK